MKYLFMLFLASFMVLGTIFRDFKSESADDSDSVAFLYQFRYKKFSHLPDRLLTDYMIVTKKADSSFTQFFNQMKIDSIKSYREISDAEFGNFTLRNPPTRINIIKDSIKFYSRIGNTYWLYKEKINYQWEILDSLQKVNGYNCRLAKTNYAGRSWYAWYTSEIPMNVGPYKFKNLPGCIIKVNDIDETFTFELIQTKKRNNLTFKPYPSVLNQTHQTISRKEFNALQQSYENLSFNEQMAYMNRDNPENGTIRVVSQDYSDETLRKVAFDKPSKYYFIEIDHLEKKN